MIDMLQISKILSPASIYHRQRDLPCSELPGAHTALHRTIPSHSAESLTNLGIAFENSSRLAHYL